MRFEDFCLKKERMSPGTGLPQSLCPAEQAMFIMKVAINSSLYAESLPHAQRHQVPTSHALQKLTCSWRACQGKAP